MLVSSRTTNILLVIMIAVGIGIVAMLATRSAAGPLDPPGAPASTDGVREPGTPITSLPYTISASGNYYLVKNLTGIASQNGITVAANYATIDLGGFVLTGTVGAGSGIYVVPGVSGTRITNGTLEQWQIGIAAAGTGYTTVTDLLARSNSQGGIVMSAHGSIEHCNASGNGLGDAVHGYGIRVSYTSVKDCVVTDNYRLGIWSENESDINGNYVRNNGLYGVFITGANSVVRDNYICETLDFGDGGTTFTNSNVARSNDLRVINTSDSTGFSPEFQLNGNPANMYPDGNNIRFVNAC